VNALNPHCVSLKFRPNIIQTQYYAEQQVENSPEELPVERLTLSLKIAAQPA